jgi:hypothetical protein
MNEWPCVHVVVEREWEECVRVEYIGFRKFLKGLGGGQHIPDSVRTDFGHLEGRRREAANGGQLPHEIGHRSSLYHLISPIL